MSEGTVVVPALSPEWLRKRDRILAGLGEKAVRELEVPGSGLTLDQLQAVWESRNPFEQPRFLSPLEQMVAKCAKKVRQHFGNTVNVDPLPKSVTIQQVDVWAKHNFRLVFLPGENISENRSFQNWIKPEKWFYDQMRAYDADKKLGLPPESSQLKRGWYLADFTVGADYTDGTQLYINDPLGTLISKLRHEGVIGKLEKTPLESRFAITNDEWREKVLPSLMKDELSDTGVTFRLERAIEFNAIGNVYDKNRGKFNCWEWFEDAFQGSDRLYGGARDSGGLASVRYDLASDRGDDIAGRPLGCFV